MQQKVRIHAFDVPCSYGTPYSTCVVSMAGIPANRNSCTIRSCPYMFAFKFVAKETTLLTIAAADGSSKREVINYTKKKEVRKVFDFEDVEAVQATLDSMLYNLGVCKEGVRDYLEKTVLSLTRDVIVPHARVRGVGKVTVKLGMQTLTENYVTEEAMKRKMKTLMMMR